MVTDLNTDHYLINQIIEDNDLHSFDSLMLRYQDIVYRMALIYCKDRENAYDITQNAFMKVYENLKSFRGESSFKTWLLKIVYYESLNWIRKHKKVMNYIDISDVENLLDAKEQSDRQVLNNEKYAILHKSLNSLNKKYKTVVYLKYFENLSLKEIAGVVNTTEGTIKNILFRSLQKLQSVLEPQIEDLQ